MSQRDDMERLLVNYHRRLQALQERQALYGLDTPIAILTEIEDIQGQIEELQAKLKGLEGEAALPSQADRTAAGPVAAAGADQAAKNSPAWLLWAGVAVLVVFIGAGLLFFLTSWANNSRGVTPETGATAPGQVAQPASTEPVLMVDELEARLNAANIALSTGTDEDRARVRSYITGPTSAYYLLAVNCLELMGAQRFKETAYLDMIDKWYTLQVGEDNYVATDGQLHKEQLKTAMIQAHNEYYSDTATALEQLIEP